MRTIFRKSTNTNSFGLRGYWCYCPETFELHSFATSQDLAKGSQVGFPLPFELVKLEAIVPKDLRADFLQTLSQGD